MKKIKDFLPLGIRNSQLMEIGRISKSFKSGRFEDIQFLRIEDIKFQGNLT